MKLRISRPRFWAAVAAIVFCFAARGGTTNFTLYVANYLAYNSSPYSRYNTVEEFDDLGNASVFATNFSFDAPILNSPVAVAVDASANVYVDCTQDNTWIEKFDPWGNNAARFVASTVAEPEDMVFDARGNLYVATGGSAGIEIYNTAAVGTVYTQKTGLTYITGLAFDSGGNLWASDEYNGIIDKVTAPNMTTFATPGNTPYGLAFDASGNLYVALRGNGQILQYASEGNGNLNPTPTVFASLGASVQPVGLAFDPAGNLYVSGPYANQIVQITPQQTVSVFAQRGLNGPGYIALLPKLYSVDRHVVAAGGGTSAGGEFSAVGTAGQTGTGTMTGEFMDSEMIGVESGFLAGPVTEFPVSTNLMGNGSFEYGAFVNGHGGDNVMSLDPSSTAMLNWTVTGAPGEDLGWGGPNDDLGLSAANGSYFLDLTGYHDSTPYNGISQTVPTTVGQSYEISYEIGYNAGEDANGLPAVAVAVTGQPTITNTFVLSGATTWETFTLSFIASAADTTVTFTGATPQNVKYIGLDNVILWHVTPMIVMDQATFTGGQFAMPFELKKGSVSSFHLLQAADLGGPWITNTDAILTTTGNGAYSYTVTPSGDTGFYRVQTP